MSDEIKAIAREWLDKYERAPDDDPTYSLTEDCLSVLLQAAFESGRQVKAGHVTRIIAELNDTWKELEHAGFTLLAAKVSMLTKELSNMIDRSLAQPAASAPSRRELIAQDILDADKTTGSLHMTDQQAWAHSMRAFLNSRLASAGSREGQPRNHPNTLRIIHPEAGPTESPLAKLVEFAKEFVHRCPMCNSGTECQDDLCYQARAALAAAGGMPRAT